MSAFALDTLSPNWKETFINDNIAPRVQLLKLFEMDNKTFNKRLENAKKRFNYSMLRKNIDVFLNEYDAKIAHHLNQFRSLNGMLLDLRDHFSGRSFGVQSEDEIYHLDKGETLHVNYSSMNTSPTRQYIWKCNHLPYLIQTNLGKKLKLEPNTMILLDNQQLSIEELHNGFRHYFNERLLITNKQCELTILNTPGVIELSDHLLTIKPLKTL